MMIGPSSEGLEQDLAEEVAPGLRSALAGCATRSASRGVLGCSAPFLLNMGANGISAAIRCRWSRSHRSYAAMAVSLSASRLIANGFAHFLAGS
jgi:hypothetical protein